MQPRRLGRYEILRPLARGGMAELFLARATGIQGFEKLVVVKRILPEMARDRDYVEMFLEEARLAAGLHHSNIVQVYDIGEDVDTPFFAMEYLHGEDVRALCRAAQVRRERVPLEHALSIAIGVAAGLHHAHEQRDADGRPLGIVHRDVSPHNVAVTFDGGVKLLDFGVAKTRRRASATRHGTLKGKLGYMSPEQCRGDELDRRSDVFAVAILLWELVAGRRLYGGRSDFGVMKSIVEIDAPRPSVLWHECPRELEAIIMRGLRREREARFATAEELQLALEAFAREARIAVSPVGLGHYVRERFGERAALPPEAERTTTLYDVGGDEDDGGDDATVVDGVVVTESEVEAEPKRQTRAVARPARGRRWLVPVVAVLLAGGGIAGWRVATKERTFVLFSKGAATSAPAPTGSSLSSVPAPASPASASPTPEPAAAPSPRPAAPSTPPSPPPQPAALEPPPVDVTPPSPAPAAETGDRPARSRTAKHTRTAHAPARKQSSPHVDLDAPLPPK